MPVIAANSLTNAELRAGTLDVAGPLTDAELRAAALNVAGPLTDAQLRVAAVDVENAVLDGFQERVTDGARVITTDHAAIHGKEGYSAYISFADVPNGEARNVVMTTGAARYVHMKYYDVWISNASGILRLYENPDNVVGGTAVSAINRNRLPVIPASEETIVHTAAVTIGSAVLLEVLYFGGGGTGPQGRAGGDRSVDIEWVFQRGETYVWTITNTSGVAANINLWLFWYEETAG